MKDKKILIIDDDPRNVFALGAVLRAKGFSCLSAAGAEEGIQLLQESSDIGAVLMDIMMPDMDGYEAIRRIRQNSALASVEVIAVTAKAMKGDREKTLEAGADAYISKPVDIDQLLHILQTQ